jgi:hypothetical protein
MKYYIELSMRLLSKARRLGSLYRILVGVGSMDLLDPEDLSRDSTPAFRGQYAVTDITK